MIVLVVSAVPAGLRGDLTKWLMEISPGVFVGNPSARIRDLLWERTTELSKDGRALLIYSSNNEQGMEYRTHRHEWEPTDFDGLTLMMRPDNTKPSSYQRRTGWSIARNVRKNRGN
ncbi:type I-E CRISPR-associated endoribonuclease Cas2e [Corynebacterium diphtheriae bv. mitis]|uniref:Type I-E CRISPR-associated endoribonuclease Cas2 n=2 Tax=Corynebacterium diphtheriae TaxID=1717 RepID=A0A1X4LT39_CORDP|nr:MULTISPECIES: type I-E CRISPR-associated endoribonuclease Cas2e [Corynebacterium]OWM36957.1 type I-E CRISPR-associated endoribonuclease Cas2 [Corynebacterium diphtheriae subsp. lausannense]AEX71043.1 CRISPR-associated protein [Corynebacterium diphtheriae CDCE 8392]MBG9256170.1 type I-E CRISPR-associated endoribonuclease Cas2 [Corynebacterium diphtheriae bv. mitis]MBG9287661.1 type I-E CRISPR-associated endoribonuclease Cas2 [Corynebacterium belfantii]MBG9292039.1 type I-E CRISPR-associated 